jgi:hypothetical protein
VYEDDQYLIEELNLISNTWRDRFLTIQDAAEHYCLIDTEDYDLKELDFDD